MNSLPLSVAYTVHAPHGAARPPLRSLRRAAFACVVAVAAPLAAQAAGVATARISFEQTIGGGERIDFRGSPTTVRWAPDGEHLVVGGSDEWRHPRTGASVTPAAEAEGQAAASGNRGRRGNRARGGAAGGRRLQQTSPDGKCSSFVRDNNLILVDAEGAEWAVSADGSENRLYGILDWVYQEEVYGRGDFQAHWWSPNSDCVAFLRLDQDKVKSFVVVDHIVRGKSLDEERHVRPVSTKYPKAGDDNPTVALGVAWLADKRVQWIDLARFPADLLIVHVGFVPGSSRVLFQVQDRVQTWLELCVADPATGKVTTLVRETAPGVADGKAQGWVNRLEQPHWLADGSFLWQSERTGRKQLQHHAADGTLLRALTAEPVVVGDIVRVDEASKRVWFSGHDGAAIERHLFVAPLDGSAPSRRLTREPGSHQTNLNRDGSLFLDTFSSLSTPPRTRLCDGSDGKVLEEFVATPPKDLANYGYVAPELLAVRCRDGFAIDATLIRPKDIPAGKKLPIWIETYSGPDAPTVRNTWSAAVWPQFLQQNGYLVLQVNVRSASGKGQFATQACYKQLAVQELMDLEDAIATVCQHPWADPARVGITGWSYGGTMTAFALTHSKAFRLGIAGAGVYDWRLYDTIYTERFMDTPQANPEGYRKASVLAAAKDLHGHLLLLHGTDDDNVHLQNCMQLVYALQRAGKQFELMLYPTATHGVSDPAQSRHMRELMWRTMQQHLQAE